MKSKLCTKCRKFKIESEFVKSKQTKSGIYPHCKQCHREKVKKYMQTARGKENHALRGGEWEKRNTIKKRAHGAVRRAIANKKLRRMPCFICSYIKTEAHHYDYEKKLDVVWLCSMHHAYVHSKNVSIKELHDNFSDCHASPEDGCFGCEKLGE